jgi:protein TonB
MFTNLIESQSHRREFKRRSSFFLITIAAYTVVLCGVGIASVYAYDAQIEAQTNSLELLNWVPPVTAEAPKPPPDHSTPVRRPATSNAPVDRHIDMAVRTDAIARPDDPTKVPDKVGITGPTAPPVTGRFRIGDQNLDLPTPSSGDSGNCIGCSSAASTVVTLPDKAPEPPVVKPPTTQRVTSVVLSSKALSLPQPPYPMMAKQMRIQGLVSVQILVDEQGKVLSAQVVSGNPALSTAAKDAAMRARFTPTILNGQPVKIQGVINYNFTMQ